MSARRIDWAQVRTGGHTGPPLRWKLPPRRAVHPKRSRLSFRNEKKIAFYLHMNIESRTHWGTETQRGRTHGTMGEAGRYTVGTLGSVEPEGVRPRYTPDAVTFDTTRLLQKSTGSRGTTSLRARRSPRSKGNKKGGAPYSVTTV